MKASSYAEVVIDALMGSQAFFCLTLFFVSVQFFLIRSGAIRSVVFVPHVS